MAGEEETGSKFALLNTRKLGVHQIEYIYDDFNKRKTWGALAKTNIKGSAGTKLSLSFSVLADKEGNYECNHCSVPYLHFAVKLNVRKLYSSLAKAKEIDAKGMHVMPLERGKVAWHLSHQVKANTVTQPYIQMGLHRVRPVTELRTVGEIELSAQRLDLEGKHSELLCVSGKSRPLVKYKRLVFTERAMTLCVLRVFVWFMKKMP